MGLFDKLKNISKNPTSLLSNIDKDDDIDDIDDFLKDILNDI